MQIEFIKNIIAVGIGGALGSICRYLLSGVVFAGTSLYGMPVGTFTVNAVGSLLIGIFMQVAPQGSAALLLTVGLCGGFTTFSTFSVDTLRLLRDNNHSAAASYIAVSIAVCVACTALGILIGKTIKLQNI